MFMAEQLLFNEITCMINQRHADSLILPERFQEKMIVWKQLLVKRGATFDADTNLIVVTLNAHQTGVNKKLKSN